MARALLAHHLDGVLERERGAVDAVAGERVEDVGDRDDAPLDRDLLAGEAARVAAAVPLLVVAERDRRGHVEDRGGGAAQQAVALLGVGLDDRALLGGERAGLQQDRVGDRDLADVVQRRGVAHQLAELAVEADLLGEQRREAPDALDVRAGVLVAELDRHREAPHGLRLRDLELGERAVQLAGAVVDLALQRARGRSPRRASRAGAAPASATTQIDGRERGVVGDDGAERGKQQHAAGGVHSKPRAEAGAGRVFGSRSLPHTFEVTPRLGLSHRLWLSRRHDRRAAHGLSAARAGWTNVRRMRVGDTTAAVGASQCAALDGGDSTRCPPSGGSARVAAVRRRLTSVAGLSLVVAVTALAGCGGCSSGNGVASKAPTEIVAAAKAAADGASTVHVSGSTVTAAPRSRST